MSYYCTKCDQTHWKGTFFHDMHKESEGEPPKRNNKADPSIDDGDIIFEEGL